MNLSVTRAEAINMATAAFIQWRGRKIAEAEWNAAETDQERYELLFPFLAFPAPAFEDYLPEGYAVVLPKTLDSLSKVELVELQSTRIVY